MEILGSSATPASTSQLLVRELTLRPKADLVVLFGVCQLKARQCGATRLLLVDLTRFLYKNEHSKELI